MRLGPAFAVLLATAGAGARPAAAQQVAPVAPPPEAAPDPPEETIDDAVARALFEQGLKLFHEGRWADARQLFAESIVRSPKGPYSRSARQMLARCNQRLGLAPPTGDEALGDAPVDPYGGEEPAPAPVPAPLDPYAEPATATPLDPYGGSGDELSRLAPADTLANPYDDEGGDASLLDQAGARDAAADDRRSNRNTLMLFGGLYGLYTGIGIAAGMDGAGGDGSMLVVLGGAGLGAWGGYWVGEHKQVSKAQTSTVASSTAWGAGLGLMFAHVADSPEPLGCAECPDDQPGGDYMLASAAGAALGLGAGVLLARRDPSGDDVALVSSFGGYGLLEALMLGVTLDPAQGRAYSVNGILGTGAGLATGLWLSTRVDIPKKRMTYVDVGVGVGALTPWVIYALAGGNETATDGARQFTGFASMGLAVGGGWLAWRWTRDMAAPEVRVDEPGTDRIVPFDDELALVPPGIVQRGARGRWRVSAVAPRPILLAPSAGDPQARVGLGIDLFSGAF